MIFTFQESLSPLLMLISVRLLSHTTRLKRLVLNGLVSFVKLTRLN